MVETRKSNRHSARAAGGAAAGGAAGGGAGGALANAPDYGGEETKDAEEEVTEEEVRDFSGRIPGGGDGYMDHPKGPHDNVVPNATDTLAAAFLFVTNTTVFSDTEAPGLSEPVYMPPDEQLEAIDKTVEGWKKTPWGRRIIKMLHNPKPAIRFLIFGYSAGIEELMIDGAPVPGGETWAKVAFLGTAPYKAGKKGKPKPDSLEGMFGRVKCLEPHIPKEGVSVHNVVYVVPFADAVEGMSMKERANLWGQYKELAEQDGRPATLKLAQKEIQAAGKAEVGVAKNQTKRHFEVWKPSEQCLQDAENGNQETSKHWFCDNSGEYKPTCTNDDPEWTFGGITGLREHVGRYILGEYEWQAKQYGDFTGAEKNPGQPQMQGDDFQVGTERLVNEHWVKSVSAKKKSAFAKAVEALIALKNSFKTGKKRKAN